MAKIDLTPLRVSAKSEEVVALIGEVAPYVKPVAEAPKPQGGGTSTGRNAQRKRALKQSGNPQAKAGKPQGHSSGKTQGSTHERAARPAGANRNRQRSR
jgi:hypothetical protein